LIRAIGGICVSCQRSALIDRHRSGPEPAEHAAEVTFDVFAIAAIRGVDAIGEP
jgi:hypothetical protein